MKQTQTGPMLKEANEIQPEPVYMTGNLVINKLTLSDSGLYTCVAQNMAGQTETLTNINIISTGNFNRFLSIISIYLKNQSTNFY